MAGAFSASCFFCSQQVFLFPPVSAHARTVFHAWARGPCRAFLSIFRHMCASFFVSGQGLPFLQSGFMQYPRQSVHVISCPFFFWRERSGTRFIFRRGEAPGAPAVCFFRVTLLKTKSVTSFFKHTLIFITHVWFQRFYGACNSFSGL